MIRTFHNYLFTMKKFLLLTCLFLATCGVVSAQVSLENSQARVLDVETDAIVRPQVVDLAVLKNLPVEGGVISSNALGRCVWQCHYSKKEVDALKGVYADLRANATFKMCEELNADVILGATYNIKTDDLAGYGIDVKIIGFPAIFTNWRDLDAGKDGEWIRLKVLNRTGDDVVKTRAVGK